MVRDFMKTLENSKPKICTNKVWSLQATAPQIDRHRRVINFISAYEENVNLHLS